MINWDVEFFHGENENALLSSTLNDIKPEELDRWKSALNNFMDNTAISDRRVLEIIFDGCEDVILRLSDGTQLEVSGIETTFQDILTQLDS